MHAVYAARAFTYTRSSACARARAWLVQVCGKRKVVSGLGIRTMKGSHPFVLRQNSDTARAWRETRLAEWGGDIGGKEGNEGGGHIVSSRSEVILREYLAGDLAR